MTAIPCRSLKAHRNQPGKGVKQAVCDCGYRGNGQVNETKIVLLKNPLKRDNRYKRDKKRKQCRRREAIEPIIGHLKSDFRLSRNYLKGIVGDEINLLMAVTAWNLKKWLVAIFWPLFVLLNRLFLKEKERCKQLPLTQQH